MDCSLPDSSVHGIFQPRILEQVAISCSRGSSKPRGLTPISCIDWKILYHSLHHLGSPSLNSNLANIPPGLEFNHFKLLSIIIHGASQVKLVVKNPPANAGDIRDAYLIPGSGRSPGGRYSNPFQYSCQENPIDRGAWQAGIHRVTESDLTEAT